MESPQDAIPCSGIILEQTSSNPETLETEPGNKATVDFVTHSRCYGYTEYVIKLRFLVLIRGPIPPEQILEENEIAFHSPALQSPLLVLHISVSPEIHTTQGLQLQKGSVGK